MKFKLWHYSMLALLLHIRSSKASSHNSKYLGSDFEEDRTFGKRRRPVYQGSNPCNFGGIQRQPKNEASGRTFFDLQYFSVEHNYNLNIECGGSGGNYPPVATAGSGPHKPLPGLDNHLGGGGGGGHKPIFTGHHKPGHGGGLFGGSGNGQSHGHNGGLLAGLFGGNPQQGGVEGPMHGPTQTGAFSGAFAGLLPSPQQFATGLSEGIQTFISTIPAIGQSFQSLLPNFDNFQLPQLPQINPGDNLAPGQYLTISNPYLGSYTQDLSIFNPTNLYNKWHQGVKEALEGFVSSF